MNAVGIQCMVILSVLGWIYKGIFLTISVNSCGMYNKATHIILRKRGSSSKLIYDTATGVISNVA